MRPVVLVVSRYLPHYGGVEEHVRNVARQLRADGRDVVVWAADSGVAGQPSEVDGIRVRYLPCPLPGGGVRQSLLFLPRLAKAALVWLRALRADRPGVLHVQCFGTNGPWAMAFARLGRIPLVVSAHGETYMDDVFDRSAVLRWSLRRALRRAEAVTACSEHAVGDLVERFGLPPGVGVVVPNGVDPDEPAGDRPAYLPEEYLLAVGRMVEVKGFDLLVEAFARARLGDLPLVIGGDGPELDALAALARRLGVADRVILPGAMARPEVVAAIAGARAMVVPSRVEAFGIVVLEGWRAGVPVVATNRGGPADLVRDGRTGLSVDPHDVEALAKALERVVEDRELAGRLGAGGRARVGEFTWAAVSRAYAALHPDPAGR